VAIEQSDSVVMRELASGNRSPYLVLCRRHGRGLCNLLHWWLGDWVIAEATAYDTLFEMFRETVDAGETETEYSFRVELFSRATWEASRRLREQKGLAPPARENFFEDGEAVLSELIDGEVSRPPTFVPERHGANGEIEESLLRMKGEQRLALLLRSYCGLSYTEISEVMGRSAEDVGQWLCRARGHMGALAAHRTGHMRDGGNAV
jgi:DNA-directed RNA polymerase specialized sigma24 family protein